MTPRFEIGESFLTGHRGTDEDHQRLAHSVQVLHELERTAGAPQLLEALAAFRADLARHFASEDEYLRAVGYPQGESHRTHHAEVLGALDRIADEIRQGAAPAEGVAFTCFDSLIRIVLLRDMEFANWLADRPGLAR
jgi:hemerythrin-like metal-binding protein